MSWFFLLILAAIAAEKKIQRDTIRKQRDDYTRRASALKRELITLKEQREELATGNEPPSPTTHNFIKENDRLQVNTQSNICHSLCCNTSSCTLFCFFLISFSLKIVIHFQYENGMRLCVHLLYHNFFFYLSIYLI